MSMNTAIVYYSQHHGNTKKLLDAIAVKNAVTLINVTDQSDADLSSFDRIGFASGMRKIFTRISTRIGRTNRSLLLSRI